MNEEIMDTLSAPETPAAEEQSAPRTTEVVGVAFRQGGKVYYFDPMGKTLAQDTEVIVSTARGDEFGTVAQPNKQVRTSELILPLRQVVRVATQEDRARNERNRKTEAEAEQVFPRKVAQHKLEMKLVDAECAFDGSKLIIYFTADGRVDFRELVKDLASHFHTRIELRQIGIRDEARMLGGIGTCGRPFCCSTFLSDFGQVSIKMAKEQNFSLNSAKISGTCGRLMCCLRFEHETYEEALKVMPRVGAQVRTPDGVGVVVETKPLAATVKVRFEDKQEAPKVYGIADVTVLRRGKGPGKGEDGEES